LRTLRIIGRSVIDFFRDDGMMFAASMSYFTMMTIVPFCLFVVTLFGYLLGHYPDFYTFFLKRLVNFFPEVTSEIMQDISKLISYKGIGKFGLVLYGLLSYQVFASYEAALNAIFKVKTKRRFVYSILISLSVVTLITALLILSFAATSIVPLLKGFSPFLPGLKLGKITQFIIRFVLPFVLVLLVVTVLYILIPKTRVNFSHAFRGAMFTTIFMEIAKHIFTWYVSSVVELGKIYGPLTAIISFLLWVYYSSSIFLIGAEIVHNSGTARKTGPVKNFR
jgi:membrane protein